MKIWVAEYKLIRDTNGEWTNSFNLYKHESDFKTSDNTYRESQNTHYPIEIPMNIELFSYSCEKRLVIGKGFESKPLNGEIENIHTELKHFMIKMLEDEFDSRMNGINKSNSL